MKFYEQLSGHTPLIRIDYRLDGRPGSVFAKLESLNLSGSIKDRVAARILAWAEETGTLRPGRPLVEVTSGNTGIAFAALGALTGHPVHIFMPDHLSLERRRLLEMYGARLHLVRPEEGGFQGALRLGREAAREMGAFQPLQFENGENVLAHFHTTAAEIEAELPQVRAFAAGVGTGGTLMGVARRLRPRGVFIAALEPSAAPLLQGGRVIGPHKIEGIGDDFIPPIVDRRLLDGAMSIQDGDAVLMAARLARELGLGVGISSGANLLGSILLDSQGLGPVATVFADDNKKYLSTSLADPAPAREDFLSPRVELITWRRVGSAFPPAG